MPSLTTWILATRPKTLIAGISPVAFGASLAAAMKSPFSYLLLFSILLTALGIQITTNFANDYFDALKGADTSQRKGPLRVVSAALVSPQAMRRALALVTGATACLGMALVGRGGPLFAALLALSLLLAFLYTAGPFPLAYLGLGELFVFLFFGPVATAATTALLTHSWSLKVALWGLAPGSISTCILIINSLRDVDEDRAARKRTLVVRLGSPFGKGLAIGMLALAWALPLVLAPSILRLLPLLLLYPTGKLAQKIYRTQNLFAYNSLLAEAGRLLWLYTALFCLLWQGVR